MAIGQILTGLHFCKPEHVERAIEIQKIEQRQGRCSKLGEILVKRLYIREDELSTALRVQREGRLIYGF